MNFLNLVTKYGFWGVLFLLSQLIITKFFLPRALLIRTPFTIRRLGKIIGGSNLVTGKGIFIDILDKNAKLILGKNIKISYNCHIAVMNSVIISDNVLIAGNVFISDHSHGCYSGDIQSNPNTPPNERKLSVSNILIGENCWIGEGVSILPGVCIGKGTIIGANSVVTKSLPAFVIAAGSPAVILKKWSANDSKWIKYE